MFWALYPLVITFVVMVTGNHWFFDAVVGAVVAGDLGARRAARALAGLAGCMVMVSGTARSARITRSSLPS